MVRSVARLPASDLFCRQKPDPYLYFLHASQLNRITAPAWSGVLWWAGAPELNLVMYAIGSVIELIPWAFDIIFCDDNNMLIIKLPNVSSVRDLQDVIISHSRLAGPPHPFEDFMEKYGRSMLSQKLDLVSADGKKHSDGNSDVRH